MDAVTIARLLEPASVVFNLWFCFMTAIFFHCCLVPKSRYRPGVVFLLMFLISVVLQVVPVLLFPHYAVKMVLYFVLYVILTGLIYQDTLLRRGLVTLVSIVLIEIVDAVVMVLIMAVFENPMPPLLDVQSNLLMRSLPLCIAASALVLGIPSLIVRRWTRGASDLYLLPFSILPLSQIILIGAFNVTYFYSERTFGTSDLWVTVAMVTLSIAADIVFLQLSRDLVRRQHQETQLKLLKQHYSALAEQQRSIRALRHDISNHLMTAQILAMEDGEKAGEYIDTLSEEFSRITAIDYCENRIADAVFYGKAAEAASRGIDFMVEASLPESIGIEETDLMSLLANLLDNALDAAASAENPRVEAKLRRERGAILLRVINSMAGEKPPDFQRTKKADKSRHGLGVSISEEICRRYDGSFSITAENGIVTADAMLLEKQVSTGTQGSV